jgi:DNA-binding NarL/FixJ family response regulator
MVRVDPAFSAVRILVVDDFEPWRQQVCSILQTDQDLHIVAVAGDGLEAVQKAEELQPDLIVLDIGLPALNGFEAAKRIRQIAPAVKIIFLTHNSDEDFGRAALSDGAQGYVRKIDAGRELFTAVEEVLGGNNFVSSGIQGANSCETDEASVSPESPAQ